MSAAASGVWRWIGVACWVLSGAMAGSAASAAAPSPIEHFIRAPEIDDVVVSPSGRRLAVLVFSTEGRRRLAVMDLDPVGPPRVVAGFGDADVERVWWVSDDRLVFNAAQRHVEVRQGGAGTFAVNHDGGEQRQLIAWRSTTSTGNAIASRILPYGWFLHSITDDDSGDIFVVQQRRDAVGDLKEWQLARLSTTTGVLQMLSQGMPDGSRRWLLDAQGQPRVVSAYVEGRTKVYWRRAGAQPWAEVADFDDLTESGFTPWHLGTDGQLLVRALAKGDHAGLFRFDPATRKIDPEPVVAVAGFDLDATPETDSRSGRLVGFHFRADRPMSYWFDPALQRIQQGVDAALPPGRSNRLYCGRCETTRFFVVRSSSDRQPAEYHLFDRRESSLLRLGTARPWIDEATQGRRSLHRVTTRDGLSMPVYVTHPAGAGPKQALPAIVLVHGGPWVRGADLGWDAQAQFLASRGYRVIEPEFRGSTGYGDRLFRAGWKEWGHAMQDDLVDAVRWAAQQGLVDADKVCITGGSYGGYASLMAPIATPGVFRCAAAFAAVSDIELMYSVTLSDFSEASRRYSMPRLIGSPEKDAERLAAASPLKRAAEIKVPVLLAHGAADVRVPIVHANRFAEAARRAGVDLDYVVYNDEGHGFLQARNHADYFGRLERFFAKHLKPAAP